MLIITHAYIVTPERRLWDGAVTIDDRRIVAVGPTSDAQAAPGAQVIDAGGQILAPGFIDLQVNGAFGRDFTADPATIWEVARRYARFGVTSFLPTVITSPLSTVTAAQSVVCRAARGLPRRGAARAARRGSLPESGAQGCAQPCLSPAAFGRSRSRLDAPLRGAPGDACAGTAGGAGRGRGAGPQWRACQRRPQHGDVRRGEGGVRRGHPLRHAPLQRNAAARPPRARASRRAAHRSPTVRRHSSRTASTPIPP